ncbi:hypothetical protein CkaCkLH20_10515 [Colletotrichum karsti]|uniref:Uncharacterized protein n=1 Tax=Colletotrichum karsti TaxID=1095194 RepID=A0A9P6HV45_9PEZI|nr:uncharacterized protein CkaCkLH20_10515 [Colletotrichum karsti]KAF9871883.1 hypothetical protein CkaCkLH20_10515 [Colletotrichum karsti]
MYVQMAEHYLDILVSGHDEHGAPLPSNPAYPWGGIGPIFRHHNITAEGDDDGSVDQPVVAAEGMGAWWARWKRHFDRLKTGGEGADGSHDT